MGDRRSRKLWSESRPLSISPLINSATASPLCKPLPLSGKKKLVRTTEDFLNFFSNDEMLEVEEDAPAKGFQRDSHKKCKKNATQLNSTKYRNKENCRKKRVEKTETTDSNPTEKQPDIPKPKRTKRRKIYSSPEKLPDFFSSSDDEVEFRRKPSRKPLAENKSSESGNSTEKYLKSVCKDLQEDGVEYLVGGWKVEKKSSGLWKKSGDGSAANKKLWCVEKSDVRPSKTPPKKLSESARKSEGKFLITSQQSPILAEATKKTPQGKSKKSSQNSRKSSVVNETISGNFPPKNQRNSEAELEKPSTQNSDVEPVKTRKSNKNQHSELFVDIPRRRWNPQKNSLKSEENARKSSSWFDFQPEKSSSNVDESPEISTQSQPVEPVEPRGSKTRKSKETKQHSELFNNSPRRPWNLHNLKSDESSLFEPEGSSSIQAENPEESSLPKISSTQSQLVEPVETRGSKTRKSKETKQHSELFNNSPRRRWNLQNDNLQSPTVAPSRKSSQTSLRKSSVEVPKKSLRESNSSRPGNNVENHKVVSLIQRALNDEKARLSSFDSSPAAAPAERKSSRFTKENILKETPPDNLFDTLGQTTDSGDVSSSSKRRGTYELAKETSIIDLVTPPTPQVPLNRTSTFIVDTPEPAKHFTLRRNRNNSSSTKISTPSALPSTSTARSPKLSSTKRLKMPNFALIHQRANDKLENIQELHERKMERAKLLLSGLKPVPKDSPVTRGGCKARLEFANKKKSAEKPRSSRGSLGEKKKVVAGKAGYNRFGFKLEEPKPKPKPKLEQVKKAVAAKCRVDPPETAVDKRRANIKGVRSNRRFDLLMEMRMKSGGKK